ncbi:Methyltransferase FkbM domain protein [uncultured archaeon]|nr:Methyltransferase FkbM domain protein [uncultured archaeon]
MIQKLINFFKYKLFGAEIKKTKLTKLIANSHPLILEIGANRGTDSEEFLRIFPNARLFLFEPDPRMIKVLQSKFHGDKRVRIEKVALSDKQGISSFFLSESSTGVGGKDSSSLKEPKKHLEIYPEINFNKKIGVKTNTLDNWARKNKVKLIDFIWADVQGAEKELITGGKDTLNNRTKYFYTEFYNQELYKGQINLNQIRALLPSFKIVGIWGNNVLFKNKRL